MISATTGYEALSFMDCIIGYNQIQMALKYQDAIAFRTLKDIFCYRMIPFAPKNVGATYQSVMQIICDDMLHKTIVLRGRHGGQI